MIQNADPEKEVYALLENLEIASACGGCGRLSMSVLSGGCCPHCGDADMRV
ncbi:MAG TPA: hypothetical protein VE954_34940 [Oligoflexus sp.]|uniref:hypothetical protein n=1 Tax=Oligoflexus sp. TaxID=1971216 RepID=UPI002D630F85|nr:hypothetical protein [Oligoflexus sp.]HYX38328.1 hypothetical protein [Oligoflexus sp.]